MKGKLERSGDAWRLRFERTLAHPPEKVWRAITESEHLAAWFPDTIVVSEWSVGAPLRFGQPGHEFDGEVLAVEEGAMVAFRWGTDVIRLELRPDGDGTRLTLTDAIDQLGKAARDAAGWHACLDQLEARTWSAAVGLRRARPGVPCIRATSSRSGQRRRPSGRLKVLPR